MKNIHSILVVFSILLFWQGQAYALCNVGDSVSVAWKGYWYAARVINTSPDQCLITYDEYDNSWDEWVGPDRYLINSKHVLVLWKGDWYKAKVLERGINSYLIAYEGYDSSWNEWVDNQRISSRPSKIQLLYIPLN